MNRIVTKENVYVGMKVVRGPDWKWVDQDAGSRYGTVIGTQSWDRDPTGGATVEWEDGRNRRYRIGYINEGIPKHDLVEYEDEFVTKVRELTAQVQ